MKSGRAWAEVSLNCCAMLGDTAPFSGKLISRRRIAHVLCARGAGEAQRSDLLAPYSGIIKPIKFY